LAIYEEPPLLSKKKDIKWNHLKKMAKTVLEKNEMKKRAHQGVNPFLGDHRSERACGPRTLLSPLAHYETDAPTESRAPKTVFLSPSPISMFRSLAMIEKPNFALIRSKIG